MITTVHNGGRVWSPSKTWCSCQLLRPIVLPDRHPPGGLLEAASLRHGPFGSIRRHCQLIPPFQSSCQVVEDPILPCWSSAIHYSIKY
ncbi:hypothetical protein Y032_0008g341 [Ancylostoma ceylanicum]|uniref:Uncharacterized protein n=1 Tax=Ancylostoma ceylanicum TaxID=53326 RepID=A0A016VMY3_9BILA|nr:hypothetical protein Y032_0008g341 [Ancylostoma ceylanicum]